MNNGILTWTIGRLRAGHGRLAASFHAINSFAKATAGNMAVEYALCVGGVGALGVGGFSMIGTELVQTFEQIGRHICLTTRLVCVG